MKLLKEDIGYKIKINKYLKKDFVLTKRGVWMLGEDISASQTRSTPRTVKWFIPACHICQYNTYLYIPQDKSPDNTVTKRYPEPISTKILNKYDWGEYKKKWPYRGV